MANSESVESEGPKNTNTEDDLEALRDSLPADLDASNYVGPYLFPDNSRRRIPGILYILIGAVGITAAIAAGDGAVMANRGSGAGGAMLILFGLYHVQAGWHLAVNASSALAAAAQSVSFPVGHASAQLAWRGLRSRPTWRVLLYSHEARDAPPSRRGIVLVDGVSGEVVDGFVEDNPEDWPVSDAWTSLPAGQSDTALTSAPGPDA